MSSVGFALISIDPSAMRLVLILWPELPGLNPCVVQHIADKGKEKPRCPHSLAEEMFL